MAKVKLKGYLFDYVLKSTGEVRQMRVRADEDWKAKKLCGEAIIAVHGKGTEFEITKGAYYKKDDIKV